MKSILEELFYGNIRVDSGMIDPDSPYGHAIRQRIESKEKLLEHIDETEKEIFEAYADAQDDIESIARLEKFRAGFRLGALLMLETLQNED